MKFILQDLEKGDADGGPNPDEVLNVKNIMSAYRSGALTIQEGMVTYWSKGIQVRGPQQFDWEHFQKTAREINDPEGLWVEGV